MGDENADPIASPGVPEYRNIVLSSLKPQKENNSASTV